MKRFLEEVLGYVKLDASEQHLLRELHPRIAPFFPEIARELGERELVAWMESGLLGPHDDKLYAKRFPNARTMFLTINGVRAAYIDKIIELYPVAEASPVVRAVNKLLDVELAVMLRHYQLDSEARAVQRERRIQADKLVAMQTLSSGLAHEVRNPLFGQQTAQVDPRIMQLGVMFRF